MTNKNALKGAIALGVIACCVTQPALADAILTGAEVTAAADGSGGDEAMKSGALWAISLTVAAVVVGKVLGIIKK